MWSIKTSDHSRILKYKGSTRNGPTASRFESNPTQTHSKTPNSSASPSGIPKIPTRPRLFSSFLLHFSGNHPSLRIRSLFSPSGALQICDGGVFHCFHRPFFDPRQIRPSPEVRAAPQLPSDVQAWIRRQVPVPQLQLQT